MSVYSSYMLIVRLPKNLVTLTSTVPSLWASPSVNRTRNRPLLSNQCQWFTGRKNKLETKRRTKQEFADLRFEAVQSCMLHLSPDLQQHETKPFDIKASVWINMLHFSYFNETDKKRKHWNTAVHIHSSDFNVTLVYMNVWQFGVMTRDTSQSVAIPGPQHGFTTQTTLA